MRPLTSYISECFEDKQPVFESFGSTLIEQLMTDIPKTTYSGKMFRSMVKWDEITDDDIEMMRPEEAKKVAYKRNSYDFILWCDEDDHLMAWSLGTWQWQIMDRSFYRTCKNWNVKKISEWVHHAYVIKDYNKFSTNELRRLRREAQENALYLKTDEEVREENMKRYEEMKDIIRLKKDANAASLNAKLDQMVSKYDECREVINSLGDLKQRVGYLSKLSKSFGYIITFFYDIVKPKWSPDKMPEELRGWDAKELVKDLNEFETMLDKFINSADDIKTIITKTQAQEN